MTTNERAAADVVPGGALAAVRAIRSVLMENRFWADEHARMAPAVLEAARAAGVFTLFAPREVGGGEVPFPEMMAVFEELGYADPTVAWHAANSGAMGMAAARLGEVCAAKIYGGERGPFGLSVVASGRATPEPGGFRLSGQWPGGR